MWCCTCGIIYVLGRSLYSLKKEWKKWNPPFTPTKEPSFLQATINSEIWSLRAKVGMLETELSTLKDTKQDKRPTRKATA